MSAKYCTSEWASAPLENRGTHSRKRGMLEWEFLPSIHTLVRVWAPARTRMLSEREASSLNAALELLVKTEFLRSEAGRRTVPLNGSARERVSECVGDWMWEWERAVWTNDRASGTGAPKEWASARMAEHGAIGYWTKAKHWIRERERLLSLRHCVMAILAGEWVRVCVKMRQVGRNGRVSDVRVRTWEIFFCCCCCRRLALLSLRFASNFCGFFFAREMKRSARRW